jgi:cellulose synthase operon protein B
MMHKIASIFLLAATSNAWAPGAVPLLAQSRPFDMSREAETREPRTLPLGLAPDGKPGMPAPAPDERARLHILPAGETRFSGEMATRSWTVVLTGAAPETAHLRLGYQNSVMVAPEISELKVSINGTDLGEIPIQSSAGVTDLDIPIPEGVLQPGPNLISVEASQRHRTDCTVESTYELWTDLDPNRTFLSFQAEGERFSKPLDLAGIGLDGAGQTRVDVVAPGFDNADVSEALLTLAQGLAVLTNAPHLSFAVARGFGNGAENAALTLVVGTDADLDALGVTAPGGTGFVPSGDAPDAAGRGPLFAVSAPTPAAINDALGSEALASATGGDPATWPGTTAPLLASDESLEFGELGVPTQQFSGRRYSREFSIAVPADFYAQAYGEALIMLDAAISREVRPGSRIDIFVNDRIATTVPIMDTGGGVLRQLPIRVGLREIRPGPNRIRLEAVMLTEADDACAPGTTASDNPRFAIFDTSRFVMPEYARIAQQPDLSAFAVAGTGRAGPDDRLPVVLDERNEETLAAAMNIAGRMAASSGDVRPVSLRPAASETADASALFIAPISRLSAPVLEQVRIASPMTSGWAEQEKTVRLALDREGTSELDDWRDSLETSPIRRQMREFTQTLYENFDLSLAALRLVPGEPEIYSPEGNDTILLAQATNPAGTGTWTVVTAPTPETLSQGTADLADRDTWNQIGGRMSVFDATEQSVTNLQPLKVDLVPTQPLSFANARLIATNWMSANALAYSLLLALACVILGAVTLALLSQLGRRS